MSAKENVIAEAMKLSEADRWEVTDRLLESLAGPPDPDADHAWAAEINRRLKFADSGQAHFVSWDEARRRIVGDADAESAD